MTKLYPKLLCWGLVGYAVFYRRFAYLGLHPYFYVGEILLFLGLAAAVLDPRTARFLLRPRVVFLPLYPLFFWGAIRTLPYVGSYGANALRDAVLWGYAIFAFLIYAFIRANPQLLPVLLRWYGIFAGIYPFIVLYQFFGRHLVRLVISGGLTSSVVVSFPKIHDAPVHLFAGGTLFVLLGLGSRRPKVLWAVAMLLVGFAIAVTNRGGLLGITLCWLAVLLLWKRIPRRMTIFLTAVVLVAFISPLGAPFVRSSHLGRKMSVRQIVDNVVSLVSTSRGDAGTKNWRLAWWAKIIDYTIFGEHFWAGKGFGINLADDDGFQLTYAPEEPTLRSPHNGHLNVLARTGVPGFLIWMAVHGWWLFLLVRHYSSARRKKRIVWERLFLLLIGYFVCFFVISTFGVVLEGPMNGIWFWVIYGVGLAAVGVYRTGPEALDSLTCLCARRPRSARSRPHE